jgi:hypothetical protein
MQLSNSHRNGGVVLARKETNTAKPDALPIMTARNFLQVRASFYIALRNVGNNRATFYAKE